MAAEASCENALIGIYQHVICCFITLNATPDTHLYPDSHFLKIVHSSLKVTYIFGGVLHLNDIAQLE